MKRTIKRKKEILNRGILMIKLIVCSWLFSCSIIMSGCDFAESSLVKEQAITFEHEISYRQRKELELEGKLELANNKIESLQSQLECKTQVEGKQE